LVFFTVWSWLLLGLYFLLASLLYFTSSVSMCSYVLVIWELAAPNGIV
jgi:hypothetical protein